MRSHCAALAVIFMLATTSPASAQGGHETCNMTGMGGNWLRCTKSGRAPCGDLDYSLRAPVPTTTQACTFVAHGAKTGDVYEYYQMNDLKLESGQAKGCNDYIGYYNDDHNMTRKLQCRTAAGVPPSHDTYLYYSNDIGSCQ